MKKLFYTVEKETTVVDTIEECTGWKKIQVYEIALDQPKFWFDVETRNDESNVDAIQSWLDDNGFGDREYEFEWL